MDDEFSLDEARETLFTLQRACERHASVLGKAVEALNSKKESDEWLLEVLDEAAKGISFHQQQLSSFTTFHERVSAYIEEVRSEAHQLALQELSSGVQRMSSDGGGETGDGAAAAGSSAAAFTGLPPRPKSSKTVHPELLKFKLEKQAKILGKYGGIPALGAGLVLPRLQRDAILKATGSPAAREIHYSKVENKDAPNLAEVMRFKVRKSEEAGLGGGTPAPSPWQAELSAKKGKVALDGTDAKDQVTPSTRSHAVYGEELGSVLQQRQAALEEALQAERNPVAESSGPQISGDAMDELADKLRRRQAAAKQVEEAAAAAEAEALEAAATPATPAWSNPSAPFGGELAAALQRRAEQQRVATPTPVAETPAHSAISADAAATAATPSGAMRPSVPLSGPLPTPQQPKAPGNAGCSEREEPDPATPLLGLTMQARRSMPPLMMTPPGGAITNELQAKLQRRLSAVDSQAPVPAPPAPPPAPPAVAAETQ